MPTDAAVPAAIVRSSSAPEGREVAEESDDTAGRHRIVAPGAALPGRMPPMRRLMLETLAGRVLAGRRRRRMTSSSTSSTSRPPAFATSSGVGQRPSRLAR